LFGCVSEEVDPTKDGFKRGKPGTADNHRLIVALTFDFDAELIWVNSDNIPFSGVSRGKYGAKEGLPRILNLLNKYQLPATFFIPGYVAERYADLVRSVAEAGYEIGHHGYLHESPATLTPQEERQVIEQGIEALERIVGKRPRGYRAPAAAPSKATNRILLEYGFEYDSSEYGADRPYWVLDQGVRTNLVELPLALELTDAMLFLFLSWPDVQWPGLRAPSDVEEIWRGDFDGAYEEGGDNCYVLTMHPQIIGRHHRMQMLERLILYMLSHDGVWFAQMSEISDHFRKLSAEK